MPLDPDFVADSPYGPGGLLIDEVLEIDKERGFVRARMPTHDDLPITREQRAHPVRHPRHVSGGLMVHMTGVLGLLHAYYVMGLKHANGWVGYGGKINVAKFKALAKPGSPLILEATCLQSRVRKDTAFSRYEFHFFQDGTEVYEGDQSAMWLRPKEAVELLGLEA
ncbi:MAG: hypothetical protein U0174_06345 [Polyangiaceae bacterium]